MRSLSLNSRAMLSTVAASSSQYLHQVVQNSNSTTLPFTDSLLNCAPLVVLARKRGAGWPVSSPAEQKSVSKRRVLICNTRPVADARMARTISQRIEVARNKRERSAFWNRGNNPNSCVCAAAYHVHLAEDTYAARNLSERNCSERPPAAVACH